MLNFAIKYRPRTLEDIVGQDHLVGKEGIIRKFIKAGRVPHIFFTGPPGTGKTTLAGVIALMLSRPFYEMNATTFKIDELRNILKSHTHAPEKPLIFIDEVHRLSKNQQEVLLPFMERNSALIIGASTENPYYALTASVRSRSHILTLNSINNTNIKKYLISIIKHEKISLNDDALRYLISSSGGDMRAALNLLESASTISSPITVEILKQIRPQSMQKGSSEDENHYELTSAMIKSIRGSDIDAGLYYLARLIDGGEPAEFIARRLMILASEDIGNANPHALNLASSTLNIVKHIGYPEASITLSQLVIYLASSPKSNAAYHAIKAALESIRAGEADPVPSHIKPQAKNYKSPHNFGGWVRQAYLSRPHSFYHTRQIGFEKTLWQWHEKIVSSAK